MTSKELHEQGVTLFRKGKFDAALDKLNEALGEAGDDTRRAAEIYSDIGVTYKQLEDYPAAHHALDEASQRFTALADQKGQAQVLGNRAAVYESERALEQAVETYKQSAAMFEALGENELAMYVWQAVSRLRMNQKQYIAAIGAYEEGIDKMPDSSLKKKILQEVLKVPRSMLGGPVKRDKPDQDD
jgi:tetratricopeptide (TPR) repeat protein